METPSSSSRRITRSQALAMAANNTIPITSWKNEEFEKGFSKSVQKTNGGRHEEIERSALIDITNDSPIVGLAIGNLRTPFSSSRCSNKKRIQNSQSRNATSPGSGEALLRGQVKTLLQKVEEEAVISKISFESRISSIRSQEGFVNSPIYLLLAPTPANTPQVPENVNKCLEPLGVSQDSESFDFSQILDQEEENGEIEEKSLITRLLFTDSIEKFQENEDDDDDDASLWSVQVNASRSDEHDIDQEFGENYEDDQEFGENYENDDDQEFGENYDDEEGVDELCEGLSKICVNGGVKFSGKHKRFVYDSDGELEAEEEAIESSCFKGLPTPKGTHLRFA
ncbi:hypothetical protein OSB04_000452 [Centaurea solstitialis]|uniref:Uncharacterized protein n=1 Tax=Centaurea solstitialis TaxID=347529 RepID=A0AA38WUJ8_9ASTR|nr:hypothetical protein OSB04_000452 [Centaurea solstitialis]